MATHYDRIIVTEQSAGRLSAWHKHRCARVAKKYEDAFVVSRAACRQRPVEVIEHVRHLGEEAGIRLTVRAQRRLCIVGVGATLTLPTYANNAAAILGGLTVNQLYKVVTGEVRVVV